MRKKSATAPHGAAEAEAEHEERVRTLFADIEALANLVFPLRRPVGDANTRMVSTLLRRWLIDGDLARLLRDAGSTASFDVQSNELAQAYASSSQALRYYVTAGIMVGGRPTLHIYDSVLRPEKLDREFMREGRRDLPLSKFLSQPRLLHAGRWFTTRQILTFAANKLGGNHLDFARVGEWAALNAANSYMRFGGPELSEPPAGAELYLVIEPASDDIVGAVHLEVIAAASSFVQMRINHVPILNLRPRNSLGGLLRKLVGGRPRPRLSERKVPKDVSVVGTASDS